MSQSREKPNPEYDEEEEEDLEQIWSEQAI